MSAAPSSRRVSIALLAACLALGAALGLLAPAEHRLAHGSGVSAIALLTLALLASPLSRLGPPRLLVLRAARRSLGLAAAAAAALHALAAWTGYLPSLSLAPIAALAWIRHGVLALAILAALALTSFPTIQRALRVRAWSALHRAAYAAGALAVLHALGSPFGSVWVGVSAGALVTISLVSRPILAIVRRRRGAPTTRADDEA